jgi:hypothetical protein
MNTRAPRLTSSTCGSSVTILCWLRGVLAMWLWTAAVPMSAGPVSVLPEGRPFHVFGGGAREIVVRVQSSTNTPVSPELGARLFQLTSATAAPVGTVPPRRVALDAGQCVLERFRIEFPAVRAETRFRLQWSADGASAGGTDVWVYPAQILAGIGTLTQGKAIGVHDPDGRIRPALTEAGISTTDLTAMDPADFEGAVVIYAPPMTTGKVPPGRKAEVRALAERGVAVVWFQPPVEPRDEPSPRYRTVPIGPSAVVVADGEPVTRLSEAPDAQRLLLHLVREALKPAPNELPVTDRSN